MARILQVTEAFGGGVFASVTQICNGLAERGHEVHLLYARRPETPADFRQALDARVQVWETSMVRSLSPLDDWRGLLDLRRAFVRLAPEVIHLHSSKAGFLGRLAARSLNMQDRVLYSPRGLAFLQEDVAAGSRSLYLYLERLARLFGGRLVACSASELMQIRERIGASNSLLIENAVALEKIPLARSAQEGVLRIGTLGRVSYAKNPALFARLARRVAAVVGARARLEWHWIGGGDAADCALLEAAGVQVSGWVPRAEALERLSHLDVYLQTSLWEGMPIAVIEAQVAGIPAVVSDVVGNRDVVLEGRTGFIGASEPALAEALQTLIDDAPRREQMGREARAQALARFGLPRLFDELLRAYGLTGPQEAGR